MTANKIRKQIYVEPNQDVLLKRLSEEKGLSEAEIIRQAIDGYAQQARSQQRRMDLWKKFNQRTQHLLELGPVPKKEKLRREDLYEERLFKKHEQ
jgi:hypothetical protein